MASTTQLMSNAIGPKSTFAALPKVPTSMSLLSYGTQSTKCDTCEQRHTCIPGPGQLHEANQKMTG